MKKLSLFTESAYPTARSTPNQLSLNTMPLKSLKMSEQDCKGCSLKQISRKMKLLVLQLPTNAKLLSYGIKKPDNPLQMLLFGNASEVLNSVKNLLKGTS